MSLGKFDPMLEEHGGDNFGKPNVVLFLKEHS